MLQILVTVNLTLCCTTNTHVISSKGMSMHSSEVLPSVYQPDPASESSFLVQDCAICYYPSVSPGVAASLQDSCL